MIISNVWVELTTVECLIQKQGTHPLTLAYSEEMPDELVENEFVVKHNQIKKYPKTRDMLWGIAKSGDISVSIKDLQSIKLPCKEEIVEVVKKVKDKIEEIKKDKADKDSTTVNKQTKLPQK